jgi:predicted dehydrogenase
MSMPAGPSAPTRTESLCGESRYPFGQRAMRELNVGIVGMGWVAGAHINTFKNVSGATVTAICSRRPLDEAVLEQQFGVPLKVYRDYDEMLADESLDIVDICTPHPLHALQAIAAARAGKHLIIEKPIALTLEDAKAVDAAVSPAGVKVCVCFEVRFSAQATAIRAVLDQGLLGDVHYAEVDYYHGLGPWYAQTAWNIKQEMGGSSLLTAGCHALDLLLWFMGGEVERVSSAGTRTTSRIFERYEYDTTTVTLLQFRDGRIGKVASVIDCLQPYYFHIHLVGSEGSLLDDRFSSRRLPGTRKDGWNRLTVPLVDSGDVADHPYQPQFQAFVDSIARGEDMPLTSYQIARVSHQVVFAADLAARERRWVDLSELA